MADQYVVSGCSSLTTRRGIVAEGEPVSPADISGDQVKNFQALIDAGLVAKVQPPQNPQPKESTKPLRRTKK